MLFAMDLNTKRLRQRIKKAGSDLPPTFVGMKFMRYVRAGRGMDSPYAWAIYISHDPCHDGLGIRGKGYKADRNTVLAVHRTNGTFKILGRELPMKRAREIALGEI